MPNPVSPVVTGLEPYEVVYAEDQPEFTPLPALRSPAGLVATRWKLTDEDRERLMGECDIFLFVHTNNKPLQPVDIQLCHKDQSAGYVQEWLDLNTTLDRRIVVSNLVREWETLLDKRARVAMDCLNQQRNPMKFKPTEVEEVKHWVKKIELEYKESGSNLSFDDWLFFQLISLRKYIEKVAAVSLDSQPVT